MQAFEGLSALESGAGETVNFNPNDAPESLNCTDCLSIIHGLHFVTTSPGTVRDIGYVDVQTGVNTDKSVLRGFCCLLKCLGSKCGVLIVVSSREHLSLVYPNMQYSDQPAKRKRVVA